MRTHKKISMIIMLLMAVLFSGLSTLPQDRPPRPGPPPMGEGRGPGHGPPQRHHGPPPGSELDFLSSEMRFGEKTVKGAPFSAQATIESVQTLSDGTKLTRKVTASLYRDSEGRTRREQEIGIMGPFVPTGETPRFIFISDPVSGVSYALHQESKTARKMRPFGGAPPPGLPPQSELQAKTETLNKQVIEGVDVEGTRSSITIPAGQIGNDRPLEIVSERWYSPDLQIAVMTRHSDPRFGVTTYRLSNIKREEPPHSLFIVPADYTIEEKSFPPRGKRRMDD